MNSKFYFYGEAKANSRSAGWSFIGIADSLAEGLEKWGNKTIFVLVNPGEVNQECVYSIR